MTHKTLLLTTLVLIAAVGCKKTDDQPPASAAYQAGTPGGAGAAAVPTAMVPPAVTAGPTTPAPAATTDPAVAAAITPMLTQLASTQTVAGSKALGAAMVGNVAPGAPLESQIMLQPNKCYSVVAVGMPPIAELNVQLLAVTIIPGMAPVLATDQDTGATAVLGKKPTCYKWALPLPVAVKVSVQSAGGAGVAAAQVFEK
ncbi:MAG TPA: hypothetical protein VGF76_22705 [Polyangiaceae bacterium]|jgi:hypothetical protein